MQSVLEAWSKELNSMFGRIKYLHVSHGTIVFVRHWLPFCTQMVIDIRNDNFCIDNAGNTA